MAMFAAAVPAGTGKLTLTGVVNVVPSGPNWKTWVTAPPGAAVVDAATVMGVFAGSEPAGTRTAGPLGKETVPPPVPIVPLPLLFPLPEPPPFPPEPDPQAAASDIVKASAAIAFLVMMKCPPL
jgi:hypothetical protein